MRSEAGGMGLYSRANEITHTLPATRHCCKSRRVVHHLLMRSWLKLRSCAPLIRAVLCLKPRNCAQLTRAFLAQATELCTTYSCGPGSSHKVVHHLLVRSWLKPRSCAPLTRAVLAQAVKLLHHLLVRFWLKPQSCYTTYSCGPGSSHGVVHHLLVRVQ